MEEYQIARGYLFAEYDCPYCGETEIEDHDAQGEIIECDSCKNKFEAGDLS